MAAYLRKQGAWAKGIGAMAATALRAAQQQTVALPGEATTALLVKKLAPAPKHRDPCRDGPLVEPPVFRLAGSEIGCLLHRGAPVRWARLEPTRWLALGNKPA